MGRTTDAYPRSRQDRSNDCLKLRMPLQVNRQLVLTRALAVRDYIASSSGLLMLTCFATFFAIAICVGWLVAEFWEWRQDVPYGPYMDSDRPPLKHQDLSLVARRGLECDPRKAAVSPTQAADKRAAEAIEPETGAAVAQIPYSV
jgi:hypothetical protein